MEKEETITTKIDEREYLRKIENDLSDGGFLNLKTPDEIHAHFKDHKGVTLLLVNAIIGIPGIEARMGAVAALKAMPDVVDHAVTIIPHYEGNGEALEPYVQPYQISCPMIVMIKDGKIIHCLERYMIKRMYDEEKVEATIKQWFYLLK